MRSGLTTAHTPRVRHRGQAARLGRSGGQDLRLLSGELLVGEDALVPELGKPLQLLDHVTAARGCGRGSLSGLFVVRLLAVCRDLRVPAGVLLGLTTLDATVDGTGRAGDHRGSCDSS